MKLFYDETDKKVKYSFKITDEIHEKKLVSLKKVKFSVKKVHFKKPIVKC